MCILFKIQKLNDYTALLELVLAMYFAHTEDEKVLTPDLQTVAKTFKIFKMLSLKYSSNSLNSLQKNYSLLCVQSTYARLKKIWIISK